MRAGFFSVNDEFLAPGSGSLASASWALLAGAGGQPQATLSQIRALLPDLPLWGALLFIPVETAHDSASQNGSVKKYSGRPKDRAARPFLSEMDMILR